MTNLTIKFVPLFLASIVTGINGTVGTNEFAGVPILSWVGMGGLVVAVAEWATTRERIKQMVDRQARQERYMLKVMEKLDIYPEHKDAT